MKATIELKNNGGYCWESFNDIWVKGYAFDNANNKLQSRSLCAEFLKINSLEGMSQKVKSLRGLFSIIVQREGEVFLITDICRTFPMFYTKTDSGWLISDDGNYLKNKLNLQIDPALSSEFLFSGYMTEKRTLVKGLYQVRAHEVVSLCNLAKTQSYFKFATDHVDRKSLNEWQDELFNVYNSVGLRLTKALNNRTAVLPLSGGYDSRLVLALLKEQNYGKIICFSYGERSSYEPSIASKVAKNIGVEFLRIEYSKDFINKSLDPTEIIDYELYAGNLASLPHVQDFLSVKHLKNEGLIPEDSVFIPGIAGDIFAGTQISVSSGYNLAEEEVLNEIKRKHLFFKSGDFKGQINLCANCFAYSVIEGFCVDEKVPKFVANSVRAYEYLGYSFLLPLMDEELLSFFSRVPLELKNRNFKDSYRLTNNLYDSTNFIIFKKYGIDFVKSDSNAVFTKYINYMKGKIRRKVDSLNNFDTFILTLEKRLGLKTSFRKDRNINLALSEIYLHILSAGSQERS